MSGAEIPSLTFIRSEGPGIECGSGPIKFASHPRVHALFRGQSLSDPGLKPVASLQPGAGDEVVAVQGGQNLWIHRTHTNCGHDVVAVLPPDLGGDGCLHKFFQEDNFFALLPLLHFLRDRAWDSHWQQPPPRACFMFDDPNLHSSRYGFINYARLADHAEKHNYHVSFATIPLDAWLVNQRAAKIFRTHSSRFSLLIHGNNHTRNELAQGYSDGQRIQLLTQALRRAARLQRRAGVSVARVMAAPHGACSASMLNDMRRVGFEAACISHGSLRTHNAEQSWTGGLGLGIAEIVAGLPVIPRFNLTKTGRNRVLLSAFLNQPIVLVGHHTDVANGLDGLAEKAAWINSLGNVQWLDLASMARSNYYTRPEAAAFHLVPFTRSTRFTIPEHCSFLRIEDLPGWSRNGTQSVWQIRQGSNGAVDCCAGERISLTAGIPTTVNLISDDALKEVSDEPVATRFWPVLRRQLAECRDRLAPFQFRLRKRFTFLR